MKFTKIGISMLAVAFAVGAQAQGFAYGIDVANGLYRVDLSNASSTFVGTANANGAIYESLGMDPTGTLYGLTVGGDLFSISTSNAIATYIGTTGLGNSEGMDWDAVNNRMLITDFSGTPSVYSINLGSAATQLVMTASTSGSVIRSLATRSSGSVYDVRQDVSLQGDIHGTFDGSNGAYATVGTAMPVGVLASDYGTNGVLYGLTAAGDLVSINPGTGAYQNIGTVNANSYFLGMATDVVPEPMTLTVFGLGLAALARRRNRRA